MPTISVCLSPRLTNLQDFANKTAVAVDILRATTTISAALESGAASIRPVETLEECEYWQTKGYLGAAERGRQDCTEGDRPGYPANAGSWV